MIKTNEIKKAALNKLDWKKSFIISTIFVLANVALSYALEYAINLTINIPILNFAVNILYIALFVPLSFGFVSVMTKLYKSERVSGTTIFNEAVLNFTKTIGILVRTLVKILIPSLIIIFAGVGILFIITQNLPITNENLSGYSMFISLIYLAVVIGVAISTIPYVLSSYILADNKELSSKEIVNKSADLMKNKKWNFIKLIVSFLGWFLVLAVIVTIANMAVNEMVSNIVNWIGMMLLMPYVVTSIRVFYEEVSDTKEVFVKKEESSEN